MSVCPITPTTRILRVAETTVVSVLPLRSGRFVVDPPYTCEPGKTYRAELDLATHTVTISEATRES